MCIDNGIVVCWKVNVKCEICIAYDSVLPSVGRSEALLFASRAGKCSVLQLLDYNTSNTLNQYNFYLKHNNNNYIKTNGNDTYYNMK